jgi:predicted tellurium resistance membrane protein TerC
VDWLSDPNAWVALLTLTVLEIVLGIDNIIFISILAGRLPQAQQARARFLGLAVAMLSRIALLFSINWVMRLTSPWFTVFGQEISGRDLILIGGGLFLLAKATHEIHVKLEGEEDHGVVGPRATMAGVLTQIFLLDIVFSLDSVITAIGMADRLSVMVVAVMIAVLVMMLLKGYIYFAMAFSIFVEMINLRVRVKTSPVKLRRSPAVE